MPLDAWLWSLVVVEVRKWNGKKRTNKIVEFIFGWWCGNLTYNFNIQSSNDYMISPLKSNESLPITINGSANTENKQRCNLLNTILIGNLINEKKNYNNLEMRKKQSKQWNQRDKSVTTLWMCVSVAKSKINKNAVYAMSKHLTTDNVTHSIANVKCFRMLSNQTFVASSSFHIFRFDFNT